MELVKRRCHRMYISVCDARYCFVFEIMELPRDLQKMVFRKMDMDTRIAIGFIIKLNVPDDLKRKLENMPRMRHWRDGWWWDLAWVRVMYPTGPHFLVKKLCRDGTTAYFEHGGTLPPFIPWELRVYE